MIKFGIKEGAPTPSFGTADSVGMDVTANTIITAYKGDVEVSPIKLDKMVEGYSRSGFIKIRPFERILFGTGLYIIGMDSGLELQVRSRSGMTLKRGLTVLNSPGTIDPDYRGEIGVILYNSSPFLTTIEKGERIAQLIIAPIVRCPVLIKVDENHSFELDRFYNSHGIIKEAKRLEGGFGSTGTK